MPPESTTSRIVDTTANPAMLGGVDLVREADNCRLYRTGSEPVILRASEGQKAAGGVLRLCAGITAPCGAGRIEYPPYCQPNLPYRQVTATLKT